MKLRSATVSLLFFAVTLSSHALGSVSPAAAQTTATRLLIGHVKDARSGQPIADVEIKAGTTPARHGTSATDGSFAFTNIAASGTLALEATRLGYTSQTITVNLADTTATADFSLETRPIPEPQVEVTTTRATERGSAVAFTELDRAKIKEKYWAQDVPMLLAETPGVYAYSDAGNGIGYSYVQIRGFPQRRVAVTINGIPLNDPESHEVYWVDHSDLLASAAGVQVQRGVGSAVYGASAAGGSINLETLHGPGERSLSIEAGGGTYDTQRGSVQYESGLLDNTYSLMGRFSRIKSQGYRDQSWVDLWSYAFTASRFDSWITTRLNLYGGPERLHLAYYAVDRSYLDGRYTGNADVDRKFNPLTWRNETDNFFEPHNELIQDIKLGKNAALTSALFYTPGKGYYDDMPYGPQFFSDLHLPNFDVSSNTQYPAAYYADTSGTGPYTVVASDITQRLWVRDTHYGWVPQAKFGHSHGELTVGGEWREHTGRHWGELTFANAPPPGTPPNYVFYDYTGRVNVMSGFAQEAYDLRSNVKATGSLQWRRTRYAIGDDKFNGYDFNLHYTAVNPRIGLNWNATPQWNLFGNYAHSQIEPILSEIYAPDDPTSVPLFRVVDVATHTYEDPLIHPEKLNDYETGFGFRRGEQYVKLTGFYMDFRDEIVASGQIDKFGVPITGNAARSAHKGLELEWGAHHKSGLELTGNFTVSDNRYKEFHEFVDSTTVLDHSGNAIAGFPDRLANVTLGYRRGWGRASAALVDVGRQYLDNTEDNRQDPSLRDVPGYQHKFIEEHAIVNGALSININALTGSQPLDTQAMALDIHLLNITGLKYETSGYVFDEVPYFYPASTRSVFVSLRTVF